MQTSKYGKSFDIKKRGMSRSEHKNVELPMVLEFSYQID